MADRRSPDDFEQEGNQRLADFPHDGNYLQVGMVHVSSCSPFDEAGPAIERKAKGRCRS